MKMSSQGRPWRGAVVPPGRPTFRAVVFSWEYTVDSAAIGS